MVTHSDHNYIEYSIQSHTYDTIPQTSFQRFRLNFKKLEKSLRTDTGMNTDAMTTNEAITTLSENIRAIYGKIPNKSLNK